MMERVTCVAPVNIAVIKYWGKRNETLILPLNDSISTTLCTRDLCAKTTVSVSPEFTVDRLWLNGREESIDNPRLRKCISEIRKLAEKSNTMAFPPSWHVHICSENNFPTAAGLASSAAGYACLVYTLAELYGLSEKLDVLSSIARQGSGSACRSVFGGFVQWHSGKEESGDDSIATLIAPASHWPDLRVLIVVVSDHKKKISSTTGMQRSVATSKLLTHRIEKIVPKRIEEMKKAILDKEFSKFAEITMMDSNQFHAICLDTYPPAIYMNDTSHAIAHLVHLYNALQGETKVAYTFDAGPNACLYMLEPEVPEVIGLLNWAFPAKGIEANIIHGLSIKEIPPNEVLLGQLKFNPYEAGLLQYLILSQVGEGPRRLQGESAHLLDENGLPI